MRAKEFVEDIVNMQQWKKEKGGSASDVTYDDLYRNFIHLWNTGDEWGDTLGTLFAVAGELHRRGEGPPASWDYSPGAGATSRSDDREMSDQDKYDQALSQQQGMDDEAGYDDYMDLKHVDTPTLEKFGEFLIDLRDKLEAEGKDY